MAESALAPLDPWEALWAPYDETTYAAVSAVLEPDDVVLEIGAGDLRLARRMATVARRVIAWEIRPELVAQGLADGPPPHNLTAVTADARTEPPPAGVTAAVLLMRHCTHYAAYVARLRAAGCRRFITNARWRAGVEVIDLGPAEPFEKAGVGWYACRRCGAVGFTGVDPAQIDEQALARITDVEGCPTCQKEDS